MRLLIAFLFCVVAHAQGWTAKDYTLEGAFVASAMVDWGQTLQISRIPDPQTAYALGRPYRETWSQPDHHECNPILGEHPSRKQVNTYFTSAILAHAAIANVLGGSWRTGWQVGSIGLEAIVIHRNVQIGLGCKF
jgi:hypothetical protein